MKPNQALKKLSRFIATMLGRSPDEFGLVLDKQGFVTVKELLKAITEEEGWRHVRRSHLNEILLSLDSPDFEIVDRLIRATDRSKLPGITRPVDLPKLMYTCVRRKAYPFVVEKGLAAGSGNRIVLSTEKSMAERIGRRKDQHPVTITVRVDDSVAQGVGFDRCGTRLYLADAIPAGCISGPPLPKEKHPTDKEKSTPQRTVPTEAGTFKVDPSRFGLPVHSTQKQKSGPKRKDPDWKRERRRQKKQGPKW
jgi:putative RNA 2'-phosphotransferase